MDADPPCYGVKIARRFTDMITTLPRARLSSPKQSIEGFMPDSFFQVDTQHGRVEFCWTDLDNLAEGYECEEIPIPPSD